MYQTLSCLQQHDLRLVLVAGVICLFGAAASLSAHRRATLTTGAFRIAWTLVLSALLGCSVWATHFVAILAYQQHLQLGFELVGTAASLTAMIAAAAAGTLVAARWPLLGGRLAGGAIWGLGVAVMHFAGVSSMRLPATLEWDLGLAGTSVVMGAVMAAAALAVAGDLSQRARVIAGAGLLAAAICALHFTAMGAVTLVPGPMHDGAAVVGRIWVALAVGALAFFILLAGLGMIAVERFSKQAALAALHGSLDQTPVCLAFFDRDRRLIFWNEAYRSILASIGLVPEKGLSLSVVLERAVEAHLPAAIADYALRGDASRQPGPRSFQTPDGRWFDIEHSPSGDGGFVVVMHDITAHREALLRDAEARRLAEEASAAKSRFLANMSHEIRTPLNAVLGLVQVIQRDDLSALQRERLGVIDASGRSLLAILDDLLDLTKVEAGKLEVEAAPFELAEVLRQVAAAYQPLATEKGIGFLVEADPDVQGWWRGDAGRLRQVLANLASNALKFTPRGEIRLSVRRRGHRIGFEVADTGIGVPADKLAAIFEKFTQADASTSRRFGGTGLGLAISDELVRLMGGVLRVSSEEGRGSCFAFSLPLEPVTAPRSEAPAAPGPGLQRPLRILAAEDNAINRMILAALLEPLAAEIVAVADGRDAVEAFATSAFDLVLMDIQMPGMSGLEASVEIRRREAAGGARRTPILALTANVMRHQLDEYSAAGMDGFVAKPIEAGKLFAAIGQALSDPAVEEAA